MLHFRQRPRTVLSDYYVLLTLLFLGYVPGGLQSEIPTVSKHQPEVVISKPEVDSAQPDDGLSYPVRGARLAKMIELPRAAMSPWEAAAQFDGSVEPALEHIDAYKAAASRITLDDFIDDDDTVDLVPPAEQFTQSQLTSVSKSH